MYFRIGYTVPSGHVSSLIANVINGTTLPSVLFNYATWDGLEIGHTRLLTHAALHVAQEVHQPNADEWADLLLKIMLEKSLTDVSLKAKVAGHTAIVYLFKYCVTHPETTLFNELLKISLKTFTAYGDRMQMFADIVQCMGMDSFEYQYSVCDICSFGIEVRQKLILNKSFYAERVSLLHHALEHELMDLFLQYRRFDDLLALVNDTVLSSNDVINTLSKTQAIWESIKCARFDTACAFLEKGVKFQLVDMPATLEFVLEVDNVKKFIFEKWDSTTQYGLIRLFALAAQEKWLRQWFTGDQVLRIRSALLKTPEEEGDFHIARVLYGVLRTGAGDPVKCKDSTWTALCDQLEKVYGVNRLTLPIRIEAPAMQLVDWKRFCAQSTRGGDVSNEVDLKRNIEMR